MTAPLSFSETAFDVSVSNVLWPSDQYEVRPGSYPAWLCRLTHSCDKPGMLSLPSLDKLSLALCVLPLHYMYIGHNVP